MLMLTRSLYQEILIGAAVKDRNLFEEDIKICLVAGTNFQRFVVRLIRTIPWDIEKHLRCEETGIKDISTFPESPSIIFALLVADQTLFIDETISVKIFPGRGNNYKFGITAPSSISIIRSELKQNRLLIRN